MNKIWIETRVKGQPREIFSRFNEDLFRALKPPGMILEVMRFDGCKLGDSVHLNVGLLGITHRWHSLITESVLDDQECFFTDEGTKLPPPLEIWKHTHRIRRYDDQSSLIIEDISFTTKPKFIASSMQKILEFQFKLRGPVYKKFFGSIDT